jgi:hypothetical protein
MLQLRAAMRLTADLEVEAQFDGSRDAELRKIQSKMREVNVIFSPGKFHLFHKSNAADVIDEAKAVVLALSHMGYNLKVSDGVYSRQTFALKGNDGIILQRVNTALRIFFSI